MSIQFSRTVKYKNKYKKTFDANEGLLKKITKCKFLRLYSCNVCEILIGMKQHMFINCHYLKFISIFKNISSGHEVVVGHEIMAWG